MAITPQHGLLTVDEYHALVEQGVLDEDSRVELVNGKIVEMPPIGPRHQYNVNRLNRLFMVVLEERITVSIQNSVRFGRRLERNPDVVLLANHAEGPRYYETNLPTPADVLLLVEVSDSTLATDLGEKAQQNGANGIVDYWVLDLQGDRVVVHREPTADGYASVQSVTRGETINPLAFPDVTFTADEVVG
jgi:Uma2 family endonuclease